MFEAPDLWNRLMEHIVAVQSRFPAEERPGRTRCRSSTVGLAASVPTITNATSSRICKSCSGICARRGPQHPLRHRERRAAPADQAGRGDVIGLDWRIRLTKGGAGRGGGNVQGNLDPLALMAPQPELERRIRDVLRYADGRPGHIFNLGHGILPGTPEANVAFAADCVHRLSTRAAIH